MTKEEAGQILETIIECLYTNLTEERYQELKAALRVLTDTWIPCSERLPKTNGVYIVARWFGDGCKKRILSDACYFDGSDTWYDDTRLNHGREYVTHKIVAWMPLPKPYEGD